MAARRRRRSDDDSSTNRRISFEISTKLFAKETKKNNGTNAQTKNNIVPDDPDIQPDSDPMKLKFDEELRVGFIDDTREYLYEIVMDDLFQAFVILLIIINSILMGINTYLPVLNTDSFDDAETWEQDLAEAISIIDYIFLLIFTMELGLNAIVFLHRFPCDNWRNFDFLTIVMSWTLSSFTIMRSFRIFRVFRLFGRIESLKRIVKAVASTAEGLGSIVLVLTILFYIFAVMFTQLFSDCCKEVDMVDWFGRLDKTMFTLFMLMTMDDWANIIRDTNRTLDISWAGWPIVTFMVISGVVMLNLVIAVLCEALNNLSEEKKKEEEQEKERDEEEKGLDPDDEKVYDVQGTLYSKNDIVNKFELAELARVIMFLYAEKAHYENQEKAFRISKAKLEREIETLGTAISDLKEIATPS